MLNRIEIWSKDKWTENNACDDMDDIAEQMTQLGLKSYDDAGGGLIWNLEHQICASGGEH